MVPQIVEVGGKGVVQNHKAGVANQSIAIDCLIANLI